MQRLERFAELAAGFDGFIIDLWGVIHDGVRPYPGALATLEGLRDTGKQVVLLSNAPRRASAAAAGLREMAIGDDLYRGIVTSGEVVHAELASRRRADIAALGHRVWHLGPARDRNLLDGLGLREASSPAEASFVLNTGPDDTRDPTSIAPYLDELAACRAAGLPMLCANPDLEVIRGGRRIICAGLLARHYRDAGGAVIEIGKPDPAVYQPVFAMLGLPPGRILAVGDSLRTDIAGAAAAGVAACWVLGGIHAASADPQADLDAAGLAPLAVIPGLSW